MSKRFTYRRMTPQQFGLAVKALGMSHAAFGRIFGVPLNTVTDWAYSRREIPHWVPVTLDLLTIPKALSRARQSAAEMIIEDTLTGETEPFLEPSGRVKQ